MTTKIVVGPIKKGLDTYLLPFNIDNDSFPTLVNAYQWRGRVKRKRGDEFLSRLNRAFTDASIGNTGASPWTINTIYSTYVPPITPQANATINPGSVTITIDTTPEIEFIDNGNGTLSGFFEGIITNATQANPCQITSNGHTLITGDMVTINGVQGMVELNGNTYTITVTGVNTFTLNGVDSTLFTPYTGGGIWTTPSPANFGTINYLTGVIVLTHTAGPGIPATAHFAYFPDLPVLGLEDLVLPQFQFPNTLAFDQTYSYHLLNVFPYGNYDVSFYKNPVADPTNLPGYVPKTTWTPVTWNGQDYQQFYTINYQGALWATNGVQVPFDPVNSGLGMQFKTISGIAIITAGNGTTIPAVADITINAHGLVQGDFIFINEVNGITGINFQTGYVTSADPQNPNVVRVTFPFAILGGVYSGLPTPGIAQYLTSRSNPLVDCIRWFDGDPVSGSLTNPQFIQGSGWVNFMPPLSNFNYSIADLPPAQYYLVGAKVLFAFKDRLIFFGPVVQSSIGNPIYLPDTLIFSQNGTPYYTSSFSLPPLQQQIFHSILLPPNQTATPSAFWEDQTGFGGFLSAGVSQAINTVAPNEDALILGFNNFQVRMFYTGNDLQPFSLFIINSELGSSSTFSAIIMDQGVLSRGDRGFIITSQTQCQRIDIDIPDQVFETDLFNNGTERVCAFRDFINEWVYFTYSSNRDESSSQFPDQTLLYNYRDQSWGIFNETYTTYGPFKRQSGFIWATVGNTYPTWSGWNDPWNAGESTSLQPQVIAGNQQGFICIRGVGTEEEQSLYILNFSSSLVTSPNHGLEDGDFIIINDVLGTIGSQVNGKIFSVGNVMLDTFILNPAITAGTYTGGGTITRIYVPQIQTKQFPVAWEMGRKTRLGVQQYLLSATEDSQIQLLIFLSTDAANAYNDRLQVANDSLIYSTVLYTCPESTNLGLTPANTNLQMPIALTQNQIWHRINTSLIGDTVQLGFTMSEEQVRSIDENGEPVNAFAEIELHGFIINVSPSQMLA